MRFSATVPKAEGRVVGFVVEEGFEVGAVVNVVNASCWWFEFDLIIFWTHELAR